MVIECHGITQRAGGFAEMAYAGDRPWHGLGQRLEAGAPMVDWQKAAGMDWEIEEAEALFDIRSKVSNRSTDAILQDTHSFSGKKVLFRSDTGAPLSVVGDRYKPVQPAEVLEFFTELVEDQGFQMHTAGTLFGGKKFWALAKMEEERFVKANKDGIGGFVLLSTSTDGSMSTSAKFTSIAVVCNNTLGWANKQNKGDAVRTMHTKQFDAAKVKQQLGLAKDSYDNLMKAAETLAETKISLEDAEDFIKFLFTNSRLDAGKSAIEESRPFQTIMSLYNGEAMGADLSTREGTLWGAVNAVTEYVDHHSGGKTVDRRLNQAWFGAGNTIKNAALAEALQRAA